ncbi:coiled-coil domain-containing protein 171 isoform X2 [Eleutherodactylus coqui]|uniref:coiled-coil domain-containing protein 171 isoform X2 n=1 Tax=Eleutherodactylus coqui TaxID=57060 RepID=UPI0034626495
METMTSAAPKHSAANEVTRSGPFRREKEELDEIAELRHKLTKAKNDIVELVAKHNEELSSCESRSAKLRSEVEKGKAVCQSLEYDLAVARKQCSIERIALQEEKENAFMKQELFKAQIEELQKKIHTIEDHFQRTQFGWQEAQKRLESEFKDQELQIDNHKQQQERLMSEKRSLEARIQKQNLIGQALQQKVKELDLEKNGYLDIVRRQKSEIAFGLEREDRLKQELVTANHRVKRLEESIEAERAAHLESKYNCEIIQLRIQDLEGSLQVEKANRAQTSSDLDLIRSQFREVENAYNREEAIAKDFADKLHKLEKEYSYMGSEFKAEIEKQNQKITDLSVKLQTSEETLAVMEQDLEKSKKHQISLEEAYGCNVRELQTLVESFNTPSHRLSGTSGDKDKAAGAAALQALRHTLTDYQNKLGSASNELETQKCVSARMKEELESSRKTIHTLRINIENVRSQQLVSEKELQSLGAACAERDSQIIQLQTELVKIHEGREKEQRRATECECELQKVTLTCQKDAEEKLSFLHGLYQRLVAGCVLLKGPQSMMDNFSWPELCVILQENVNALISDLRQAKEKVSHLEYACKNKADVLRDLQKKHEDSLDRLAQQMKEQQNAWQKKTKDLEQHYSVLLGETNSRAQKYQRIAEKSKDKISIYEKTKDQMALENVHVKNLLIGTENDHKSLLAACALLAGALYPLYSRAATLAAQRNFLEDQMNTYVAVQSEIRSLIQALSDSEVKRNANAKRSPKHPRCMKRVFRRGVIAVLAANRLQTLGRSSRTLFMWQEGTNKGPGLLVRPGGGQNGKALRPDEMMRCQEAWKWVTSTDLLSTISSSMSDLLGLLNQRDPDSRSQRLLIATARNCFSKLMSKLDVRSEARCLQLRRYSIAVPPDSLVRRLTRGLHRINTQATTADLTSTTPIVKCLAILKKQILAFTQRLHASEVERRSLRLELSGIKQKISEISKDVGGIETFKAQDKQSKVISYEKFRTVFDELNSALLREHEAQILLHEQSQQLLELSHKIELHSQEEAEKDQTLEETVKSLTEMKMELWRKDQLLRQQDRQLSQLEQNKRRLEESISSAESALRTAAREKEVLLNYMKSVAAAFQKIRDQTSLPKTATLRQDFIFQLPKIPPKMFETEEYTGGPDFTVFESMINSFLDIYQLACSRAATLDSQTMLDAGTMPSTGELHPKRSAAEFVPLQPEPDFSQSHANFSNINSRTFQPIRFSSVNDLTQTTTPDLAARTHPLPSQR